MRRWWLLSSVIAGVLAGCGERSPVADPSDVARVELGQSLYAQHCATCHGARLEGQPAWRERLPNGRFPAPPHDDSGHTWHHPDDVLFRITKSGVVAPLAPKGYESDMPGFAGRLSDDDIRAVLAFIKSRWPAGVRAAREEMLRSRGR